jgi:hypothetical protein
MGKRNLAMAGAGGLAVITYFCIASVVFGQNRVSKMIQPSPFTYQVMPFVHLLPFGSSGSEFPLAFSK